MPNHAGYAAAVAISHRVFDDALLSAWHSNQLRHSFRRLLQAPGPTGTVDLFFEAPKAIFTAFNRMDGILRLSGWGTISLRMAPFPTPVETQTVQWRADLRVTPNAVSFGSIIFLTMLQADFRLLNYQFDVVSGTPFSPAADAYINSSTFKDLMLTWLRETIGDLRFPIIDFRYLGPFAGVAFTTIAVQCVSGAMTIGFDVDNGEYASAGVPAQLEDFTGGENDVAVAVNPAAIKAMMPNANQMVQDQIDQYGATLERLDIRCENDKFRVTGRASMTGGAANFSLAAVPHMSFTLPGAYIPLYKKTMVVKGRTFPAIWFSVAEPSVDIDRDDWVVILVEGIGGALTLGFALFATEAFIAQIVRNITGGIASSDLNTAGITPRVRRDGNPPTRFRIEDFQIRWTGVFIGITSRLEAPAARLSGVKSIPRNFFGRTLRYEVRLPFNTLENDPMLRIRWTVVNLDSGAVLLTQDGFAAGRRRLQFNPAALAPQADRFAVSCRVYRTLGPFTTDLYNETLRLDVGPPLPNGAFVRWRYHVKNPQIALTGPNAEWRYTGDRVVERWSKFHRADKPCDNARNRSRFVYDDDVLDDLPFPLFDIEGNRYRLCDYCFFGGPASTVAKL